MVYGLVERKISMHKKDWEKFDKFKKKLFGYNSKVSKSVDAQTLRRLMYEYENKQIKRD